MKLQSMLPAGVSALLFESARRLRRLEGELVAALEAAGFDEAILPVLDLYSAYEPLLPAAARAELHRFAGRDGELLALRADFTPLLARILAPHLAGLALPLRIYYRGDVVRASGAEREQYQLGGELLGPVEQASALEREAALLFARLFAIATGGAGRIVLGFAGVLDELLVAAAGSAGARSLGRAVARRERAAARAAGSSATALLEVVERGVPGDGALLGEAGATALAGLEAIRAEVAASSGVGVGVDVDLAEFADFSSLGLAAASAPADFRSYYGGLVMRGYVPGVAKAVASGGRYDELFRRMGGAATDGIAAVGFSFRIDRIADEPPRKSR